VTLLRFVVEKLLRISCTKVTGFVVLNFTTLNLASIYLPNEYLDVASVEIDC